MNTQIESGTVINELENYHESISKVSTAFGVLHAAAFNGDKLDSAEIVCFLEVMDSYLSRTNNDIENFINELKHEKQ